MTSSDIETYPRVCLKTLVVIVVLATTASLVVLRDPFPSVKQWARTEDIPVEVLRSVQVDYQIEELGVVVVTAGELLTGFTPSSKVHTLQVEEPPPLWHHTLLNRDYVVENLGGNSVAVAVLDTGINTHPELPGYDNHTDCTSYVKDEACNGDVGDSNGHGTHVAGSIAGVTFGLTPGAVDLKAYKVLDRTGWGYDVDVATAMIEAVNQGAQVINLSLGGRGSDPSEFLSCQATAYARERGTWVVAAAGNNSYDAPLYPAACPGAITVTASNHGDWIAWWSNRCGDHRDCIAAPGSFIDSIGGRMSGTSMATPMVVSSIVTLLSRDPGVDAWRAIKEVALDLGDEGWDVDFGYGRVRPDMALDQVPVVPPTRTPRAWLPLIGRQFRRPPAAFINERCRELGSARLSWDRSWAPLARGLRAIVRNDYLHL